MQVTLIVSITKEDILDTYEIVNHAEKSLSAFIFR
jgi:hypothetical protein